MSEMGRKAARPLCGRRTRKTTSDEYSRCISLLHRRSPRFPAIFGLMLNL
jgi:hypothetical protein